MSPPTSVIPPPSWGTSFGIRRWTVGVQYIEPLQSVKFQKQNTLMKIIIRPAIKDDSDYCVEMIYSAGIEMYDYMFARGSIKATDYIRYEFEQGCGFAGYRIHSVAEIDGEVVGVASFYNEQQMFAIGRNALKNVIKFYGICRAITVFHRCRYIGSVVESPRNNEIYIANIGVVQKAWGNGVASALIQYGATQARQDGYHLLSLDVAANNHRAEKLYRHLGFEFIKQKTFLGNKNANIPDTKFYVLPLQ